MPAVVQEAGRFLFLFIFLILTAQYCRRESSRTRYRPGDILFLLMTVLSQTFLALVCGHLVAFSFLSAGHLSTL